MEIIATLTGHIVTIVICFTGIWFGYLLYKRENRHRKDRGTINKLSKQVQAYWCLEKLYAEEFSKINNKNYKSVLIGFREKAVNHPQNEHSERPSFTANQVQKTLNNMD